MSGAASAPRIEDDEALLARFAPLIRSTVAARIRRAPATLLPEDLAGAAALGLLQAVRGARQRGERFDAYVTGRIRGAVFDEMRRQDWLPKRMRRELRDAGIRGAFFVSYEESAHAASREPPDEPPQLVGRLRVWLEGAFAALPPREADVLRARYGREESMPTIARRMGIKPPRVWQLHDRALERLRESFAKHSAAVGCAEP